MKILGTLLLLTTMTYATTAVAYWTGGMTQVRTVTGKLAWKCEYSYNGQKFYRIFENQCAQSIQVQQSSWGDGGVTDEQDEPLRHLYPNVIY